MFTDIYRSTQLWEKFPREFGQSLEQHNSLVEATVLAHGGEIMKNLGDGYIAIFNTPDECVRSGVEVQRKLKDMPPLPDGSEILVRVVGHGGPLQPLAAGRGYFGRPLNRASRICQVCHPGQTLVSGEVAEALRGLPEEVQLFNLGSHHLRDLAEPEKLYQLDHPGFALHKFPPLPTLGFRPNNLVYQPNTFIGRDAEMNELKGMLIGGAHTPHRVGRAHQPGEEAALVSTAYSERARHAVPLQETAGKHRLVTITAPGGYGKSRLATQLCANMLEDFENGVFEVLLAPVGEHTRVVTTTAAALGFQFYGRAEPQQQLIDYLREKNMLVSFDNFEHVMEGKGLLAEILKHAPKVSILVTSREPLRLSGEKVYRLEPLPVGRPTGVGTRQVPGVGTSVPTLEGGQASVPTPPNLANEFASPVVAETELPEAVQLFLDRATLVKHDFALTAENFALVGEICAKLEGVPLAVELAAAWADSFTLGELLAEVEHQLELTAKMTDVPERQRSLRASLDWSYNLLTGEQREVLRAVSTFKGGFFLEAALAVGRAGERTGVGTSVPTQSNRANEFARPVMAGDTPALHKNLRTILAQLCDKGWLFTREVLEKTRFFVRDAATHQYALEKLVQTRVGRADQPGSTHFQAGGQPGEEAALVSTAYPGGEYESRVLAHAQYFAELIEREGERLQGHGQLEALKILGAELENIYEALDTALNYVGAQHVVPVRLADDAERARHAVPLLPFARHLVSYLNLVSRWIEGLPWYERMLKEAAELKSAPLEMHAQLGFCTMLQRVGSYEEAEEAANCAKALSKKLGDKKALANSLRKLGILAADQGRYEEAEKLYNESLKICREIGDRSGIAMSLNNLGVVACFQGRYAEAEKLHKESLEIFREIGDRYGIAASLNSLGLVAYAQGRYEEAEKLYQESLEIFREIGDRQGIAYSLNNLGNVAHDQGRYEEAEKLYNESLEIFREIGDRSGIAMSLNALGVAAYAQGRYAEAEKLYYESLQIRREIGDRYGIAASLNSLGLVAYNQGRYEEAERLYKESLEISREIGNRRDIALSLINLGAVYAKQARFSKARNSLSEGIETAKEIGSPMDIICGAAVEGYLLANTGHFASSAVILTSAQHQAKEMNYHLEPMEQGLLDEGMALVQAALSADELAALTAQGGKMTIDELADYALKALEGIGNRG